MRKVADQGLHLILEELRRQLEQEKPSGWKDKRILSLDLSSLFEPHGRASEDWEDTWRLTLYEYQNCWRTTKGEWVPTRVARPMTFNAKTPNDCILRALRFLREPHITIAQHEANIAANGYKHP